MHETGVTRYNGRNFDAEFVVLRIQVIVTEIKVSDTGVPVESIDHITRSLKVDPAMTHIDVPQRETLEDKKRKLSARPVRQSTTCDV